MRLLHLTASTSYGGPERQMIGLGQSLPPHIESVFVSFPEGGRANEFIAVARRHGFRALALEHDVSRPFRCLRELTGLLRDLKPAVVYCHGYKSNLLGRVAGLLARVSVLAVSRGYTGEDLKVFVYELLDRLCLFFMCQVVCVSRNQAQQVYRFGVPRKKIRVISNAVRPGRFFAFDPSRRTALLERFRDPGSELVGFVGRLSPEKGVFVILEAVKKVHLQFPGVRVVVFGDGPLRGAIQETIDRDGLAPFVYLAGRQDDLDAVIPHLDLLVLPSFTEGLPNAVLEACAAGVPVVASAVGGIPEIVGDGIHGFLVPPGDAEALARRIREVLGSPQGGIIAGLQGKNRIRKHFSFDRQALLYQRILSVV